MTSPAASAANATTIARTVPGRPIRRPTDWIANPKVSPMRQHAAANAIGTDVCPDNRSGRIA